MRLLNKLAKNGNKDVEFYLNEKMHFEAYIMAVRTGDFGYEALEDDLEKEMKLKNPKITEDDYHSIMCEAFDYEINKRDFE